MHAASVYPEPGSNSPKRRTALRLRLSSKGLTTRTSFTGFPVTLHLLRCSVSGRTRAPAQSPNDEALPPRCQTSEPGTRGSGPPGRAARLRMVRPPCSPVKRDPSGRPDGAGPTRGTSRAGRVGRAERDASIERAGRPSRARAPTRSRQADRGAQGQADRGGRAAGVRSGSSPPAG
jgi:hypothetical protein